MLIYCFGVILYTFLIFYFLTTLYSASGCPIAAKNKGKSGYEGISSLSKYGSSSSTFGPFDPSNDHMMVVDDKDKNRMDTSDGVDEKVRINFCSMRKYNIGYIFEHVFWFNSKNMPYILLRQKYPKLVRTTHILKYST